MFLTLEDPRAKIQGSRDPLGVQPVWSRFGRHLVSNLTTVSNSVRGFTVMLLGRYFGDHLIGEGLAEETDALPIFLRTEQLCAYARFIHHDAQDMRGIERVRKFLNESRTVRIEDGPDGRILGDQRTYGLWGLFSAPARVSGLIEDRPVGLTAVAREFVESEYLPQLSCTFDKLTRLVSKGGPIEATKRNPILMALGQAMPQVLTPNEVVFYGANLRDASRAAGQDSTHRQRTLASLLAQETDLLKWVGRKDITALAKAASGADEGLAHRLRRVARLEALLAPSDLVFDFMLTRHGQTPAAIARSLQDRWGSQMPHLDFPIEELLPEITAFSSPELALHASCVDHAFRSGEYETAVFALVDWNREVMARRNAAPWIQISHGMLDVRFRGTESELPSGDDLPSVWRNSYFLNSLKDIARQIGEAA